jgi:hypothetical protein
MGEPGGGEAGMRVMGGPVGNAAYAAEYVKAVVDKHKKRLKYIISLGARHHRHAK